VPPSHSQGSNRPPRLLLVVDELAAVTLGAEGKENIPRLERLAQLGVLGGDTHHPCYAAA